METKEQILNNWAKSLKETLPEKRFFTLCTGEMGTRTRGFHRSIETAYLSSILESLKMGGDQKETIHKMLNASDDDFFLAKTIILNTNNDEFNI